MHDMAKKLMIVDDDAEILEAFSMHFSELGYSVRSAECGSAALLEVEREVPDILLSDLNMPGMPGVEFLLKVRLMFPSIRVVAMSGAFSGEEVPLGVAADAFYGKGSSLHLLTKAVDPMTQPSLASVLLSTGDLSGFEIFDMVPARSGTEHLAPRIGRPKASLLLPKSERAEQSLQQKQLSTMR